MSEIFDPKKFVRNVDDRLDIGKYDIADGPSTYQVIAATFQELAASRNDLHTAEGVAAAFELEHLANEILNTYDLPRSPTAEGDFLNRGY